MQQLKKKGSFWQDVNRFKEGFISRNKPLTPCICEKNHGVFVCITGLSNRNSWKEVTSRASSNQNNRLRFQVMIDKIKYYSL